MDRDLKKRWAEALVDGKYKQGEGQLRVPDEIGDGFSYCCLGVLADLLDPNGWDDENPELHDLGDGGELSEQTLADLGMTIDQQGALARLNDHHAPFEAIADLLTSPLFKTEGESAL